MKLFSKDSAGLLLVLAVFLLFFQDNIVSQKVFCFRDISRYYYPSRFFVSESLAQGNFPFWNPYLFCGYPAFASIQHAALYPLSLLYYFFPFFIGFNWFFLFHFLIAGWGLYGLLRAWKIGWFGSLCGALSFAFSGYLVSMLNLLTTLSAVVWLSLLVLFFQRYVETRAYFWSIMVSLVLALQFMAGQPEIMYLSFLVLAGYGIYFICRQKNWPQLRQIIPGLMAMAASALTATMVQLWPFLEILKNSMREGSLTNLNTVWSFHPWETVNWLLPSFNSDLLAGSSAWLGQAWMRSGYLGIVVLILSFCGLFSRRPVKYFLLLLGGTGLLLAFGKYLPGLERFYLHLPVLKYIRYPIKYLAFFYFAAAGLCGLGAEELMRLPVWRRNHYLFLSGVILLAVACLVIVRYGVVCREFLEHNFIAGLSGLEKMVYEARFPRLVRELFSQLAVLAGLTGAFYLWGKGLLQRLVFQGSLLILLSLNIFLGNYGVEPVVPDYFYRLPTHNLQFLRQNIDRERIYLTPKSSSAAIKDLTVYPAVDFKEYFYKRQKSLLTNLQVPYHLATPDGYESIRLKNNERLLDLMATRPLPRVTKYLDLLGVKYLLSFYPLSTEHFFEARKDYIYIYQQKVAPERVKFFSQAVFLEDTVEINRKLEQENFDPGREVIIHGVEERADWSKAGSPVTAFGRITDYQANKVEIKARADQPVWLALSDTYYPGWRAFVNQRPVKIYQADYMLRAVRLPAGDSVVAFCFLPSGFWLSLMITLFFLLGWGFYFCVRIKRWKANG